MENIPDRMRAVVVRAPMQFAVEEVQVPVVPAGGLLLKVLASGLCGSDLRTLRAGHSKVTFPWIIGHEICGTVVDLAFDYRGTWKVGDLLALGPVAYCGMCDFCLAAKFELCDNYRELAQFWPGGLAEYLGVPQECVQLGNIHRVPAGMDPVYASLSEPISSCVNAQEKGQVGLEDTVVVIGSGPIGCLHICLARARGAKKVIIADIAADRLSLAEAFGPDAIIDASRVDLVQGVRRLTAGKGADVVITANPIPQTQVQAVEMARKGGRILLFGGLPTDQSRPGVDMNLVHYNALHLIGTTIFAPHHQRQALELVAADKIPLEKLITRFPLVEFKRGADLAMAGKILKAVFLP